MKHKISYVLISGLFFILPSCKSPENRAVSQDNSKDTAITQSSNTTGSKELNKSANAGPVTRDYTSNAKLASDDEVFMNEAKAIGAMEITLAKQALNSSDPKIKAFASMMITDHTRINQDLEALATKSKLLLRLNYTGQQMQELNMMKGLSGAAFDKQYKAMMVKGHAQAIKVFERGADSTHRNVKEFANRSLTLIKNHYEAAKQL